MARVVLANFDAESGAQLVQLLKRNRHSATLLPATAPDDVERTISRATCDLILLDVSCDDRPTHALLGEIVRRRAELGLRPMLLCVARVYRGPRFELDLERKGARLAYVA